MILWVSNLAWTQGRWFFLLSYLGSVMWMWPFGLWMNGLRWWLCSYLLVGDDCWLYLFLLVLSHCLWAFPWQWLHWKKEEMKQSGSHELGTPTVSLLLYCIGQSKSHRELDSHPLWEEKRSNFIKGKCVLKWEEFVPLLPHPTFCENFQSCGQVERISKLIPICLPTRLFC